MHGRVAEALIYLSKAIYNSSTFTTLLTRQDLADIASLAKESFIRLVREFKLKGLVSVEGNSFEIILWLKIRNCKHDRIPEQKSYR